MESSKTLHILIIDDENEVVDSIRKSFSQDPSLQIEAALTGDDGVNLVKKNPRKFAVVLLDFLMPEKNGADVAKELLKINSDLIVVMHSGDTTRESVKESFKAGAVDFLEKGLSASELKSKVYSFCKKYEATIQTIEDVPVTSSRTELIESAGLIGASDELAHVASLVHKAAQVDCSVLIQGESGTGKEVVAKSIHQLSKRNKYNFVPLNMGAITATLFESQLFGHLKGSFTGAMSDNLGSIRTANQGTLFMDEIGEMPKDQQAKILRVLQEKEVQAVGSNKIDKINARFVFTTNVDLEQAVADGSFRKDLFFRLNVFPILLPPLRERIKDIRPLVMHFKNKYKGQRKVILMEVIRQFEKYSWPGNIRELENEMQKLVEVIPDDKITLKHLDSKFFVAENVSGADLSQLNYQEFKDYARNLEANYIKKQVNRFKSLREAATEGLKISESTLRGRLVALNIKL